MSDGNTRKLPECHVSSIDELQSQLMRHKEVCVTFSNCMIDHLQHFSIGQLENVAVENHVKAKYKNKRFVGILGEQDYVDIAQKKFCDLALREHREFCDQIQQAPPSETVSQIAAPADEGVNQIAAPNGEGAYQIVASHGEAAYQVAQTESLEHGTDAAGSSVDGPVNLGAHKSVDNEAGASHSGSSYTEYIDIEHHVWNYILYKNCNLIGEFSAKYDCSISAIPCDSRGVKMCKIALSSSNKDKLHEAAEEIAELCRVLMEGDIVECAVNFPSRDDLNFIQSQLESINVLVASPPCSLIGPAKIMDLAKSKFEAAVRTRHRNCETSPGEDTAQVVPRDLQEDLLRFETRAGLVVHVRQGNIIQQKTDAIVDAANTRLRAGSGVAKAIADAAGQQVEDECRKYIKKNGELRTAEPMHTSAGKLKLPIRYIIHVAGPDSKNYKDKNVCQDHLQQTFMNCLQYANERLGVCSIAIPAISSGVYGVPKDVVARRAYAALMDYDSRLLENPKLPRRLRDIHLVNIDAETTSVMQQVLSEICCDDRGSPPPFLSPPAAKVMQHMTENQRQVATENQRQVAGVHNGNVQNAPVLPGVGHGNPAVMRSLSDPKPGDERDPSGDRSLPRQNSRNKPGDDGSGDLRQANVNRSNSPSADRAPTNVAPAQSPSAQDELTPAPGKVDAQPRAKEDEAGGGKVVMYGQNNRPLSPANQGATANPGTANVTSSPGDSADRTPEQQDAAADVNDDAGDDDANPEAAAGGGGGAGAGANDDNVQQGAAKAATGGDDKDEKTVGDCVICMDKIENELKLDCGHVFCEECIAGCFEKHQPKCPSCGLLYGVLRGNQPNGTLRHATNKWSHLAGYEKYGTIEITYYFPNGIQSDEHPNPGVPYKGTTRTALLPDNPEGREVLELLRRAFDARLLFTIDRSVTTGQENVIVWNDIHQKTKPTGEHGYPDPGYLDRVKAELAAKGIKPDTPVVIEARRNRNNRK